MSYMTELHLTLNNATAASATHARLCAACDESFAAPLVASMGACPSPTVTTVKGQATLAGLSLADAQQNEFVIVAALADLHEVETTAVAVAFSSYTRRRLSGASSSPTPSPTTTWRRRWPSTRPCLIRL